VAVVEADAGNPLRKDEIKEHNHAPQITLPELTLLFTAAAFAASVLVAAPEWGPQSFSTPREAAQALLVAAEAQDMARR
jgi:hypothetical protein